MSTEAKKLSSLPNTQEALRQSERRFRALVENNLDGITLFDQDGRPIYTSASMHALLGYSPDEFLTLKTLTLIHPDDQALAQENFAKVLQHGGTVQAQLRVRHKNGTWRWLESVETNLLDDADVQAVVSNFRDITDRQQAKQERKDLLQKLQETNALLDTLFNKAPIGLGFWDRDLKFVRVNDALAEMNGLPAEAHLGKTVEELLPAIDTNVMKAFRSVVETGASIVNQEAHGETPAAPGQQRYWSVSYYPVQLQDHIVGVGAVCEEITKQKQAEEERQQFLLRELAAHEEAQRAHREAEAERQRLHDLFMEAPFPIAIFQGAEHVYELANPLYCQMLGRPELTGKSVRSAFPELADNPILSILDSIYTTGEPFVSREFSAMLDRHNNNMLDEAFFTLIIQAIRDTHGTITGLIGIAVEVTDQVLARRQVEELAAQLELERARMELAQKAGKIGTFEWNFHTDIITWTEELEALYGLPPGGFDGKLESWAKYLHPEDHDRAVNEVQKAAETASTFDAEFRVVWPDTSIHWITARANVLLDEKGQPSRMIGINIDITEFKELEQRKDEFISLASHELKTPITSIKGFTQLLVRRFKKQEDEQALRFLNRMDAQLDRLTTLISDLLDVSKIQTGKLSFREERFDFNELLQETVENIQPTTQTHHIELETDGERIEFVGDKDRLGQVLINLLTNAIKYSPEAHEVRIRVSSDKEHVQVSVQDFGIGIAHMHQGKIFERFYQVNDAAGKSFPGLGIGLYISHEIIQRHHGQMQVASEKGQGSTFTFTLPL